MKENKIRECVYRFTYIENILGDNIITTHVASVFTIEEFLLHEEVVKEFIEYDDELTIEDLTMDYINETILSYSSDWCDGKVKNPQVLRDGYIIAEFKKLPSFILTLKASVYFHPDIPDYASDFTPFDYFTISKFRVLNNNQCEIYNLDDCQKDRINDNVISVFDLNKSKYINKILSLSDEDIRKGAENWVFVKNSKKWSNNDNTAGDNFGSFIAGAKWVLENKQK